MRVMKAVIFTASALLFVVACSSSEPATPQTKVDGMVVSDGTGDMDRELTAEEVAQFAEAYVEVTAIQQQFAIRLQEADEMEHEELIEERDRRSEEAIYDSGMTSEEFNFIAVRLPDDDALRARVRTAIQERDEQRIEETGQQLETQESQ